MLPAGQGVYFWGKGQNRRKKEQKMRKKIICPSCGRECGVMIGDAGELNPKECKGCGASLPVEKKKTGKREQPGHGPVRTKK
jgi:transcription elongation factor Elf1